MEFSLLKRSNSLSFYVVLSCLTTTLTINSLNISAQSSENSSFVAHTARLVLQLFALETKYSRLIQEAVNTQVEKIIEEAAENNSPTQLTSQEKIQQFKKSAVGISCIYSPKGNPKGNGFTAVHVSQNKLPAVIRASILDTETQHYGVFNFEYPRLPRCEKVSTKLSDTNEAESYARSQILYNCLIEPELCHIKKDGYTTSVPSFLSRFYQEKRALEAYQVYPGPPPSALTPPMVDPVD